VTLRDALEITAFIATTIGLPVGGVSVGILVWQTRVQQRQTRREALAKLYAEQDTHEARLARQQIYNSGPERLRLRTITAEEKQVVDETLATLERMVYPVFRGYLSEEDAFNLYGGVVLSVSKCLWPYIEDQREMRARASASHKLLYRRYLEEAVRAWAKRYAQDMRISMPPESASTRTLLNAIFPERTDAS
jgi:thiaminase